LVKTLVTPAEFEELMASLDHLAHLDRERKAAIARLVFEVVADCSTCGEGVRRCDARGTVIGFLFHLDCMSDAEPRGSGSAGGSEGEEVADA
jgi:hypothetical protein